MSVPPRYRYLSKNIYGKTLVLQKYLLLIRKNFQDYLNVSHVSAILSKYITNVDVSLGVFDLE